MTTKTSKVKGPLDQAGNFFHRSPGVVHDNTDEDRRAAVKALAVASAGPEDFLRMVDMLGLMDTMRELAHERRAA